MRSRPRQRGAAGTFAAGFLSGGDCGEVPQPAPLCATRHHRSRRLRAARRDVGDPATASPSSCRPRRRCSSDHRGLAEGGPGRRPCAWRSKSRSAPTSNQAAKSTMRCGAASPRTVLSGSTIISARKRCRTCSLFASPNRCSSRCGTRPTSITSRSPSPRRSGSRVAAIITTRPARCATWCRTTCSSCWRWWRWSRRRISTPPRCATRR